MMLKLMRIPRPALRRRVPVSPVRDSAGPEGVYSQPYGEQYAVQDSGRAPV